MHEHFSKRLGPKEGALLKGLANTGLIESNGKDSAYRKFMLAFCTRGRTGGKRGLLNRLKGRGFITLEDYYILQEPATSNSTARIKRRLIKLMYRGGLITFWETLLLLGDHRKVALLERLLIKFLQRRGFASVELVDKLHDRLSGKVPGYDLALRIHILSLF